MRIPWGDPTFSDATKVGLRKWDEWGGGGMDQKVGQLLLLVEVTEDFPDLDDWDVEDTGGNVTLAGGVVSVNGSGAWNVNGISKKVAVARTGPCCFEHKLIGIGANSISDILGALNISGLTTDAANLWGRYQRNHTTQEYAWMANSQIAARLVAKPAPATWYTIREYHLKDAVGNYKEYVLTIEGGVWTTETIMVKGHAQVVSPASLYWQLNRNTNNAARKTEIKEWRYKHLYDTGGEYMEFIADAGVGKTFDGVLWTNVDLPGTIIGTNLKYKRSIDAGAPAYDAAWQTLAQMQGKGAEGGDRYIRLRVQLNSDNNTQQLGAALNADDACSIAAGGGGFPGKARLHNV